ncbi:N-formyl-beta-hydroxy-L-kynurenine formamidase Ecm14 [Streptomyces lasalocidi]|uniref:Esterase n=1 Tax=Streptomyces lasalocidi TaxID=324833 RepID=Q0X0B1_STRLS|nr:N-formyl-beta-hydroxy-L-kynurenine formamidase Ecm14 [Streptomyces lasalocidi]TKS96287.1 N-formyl-beta-hydroxy-L-kynurenine formamidase Ecm14 [Streptomyces lasalocidi]BAE98163.1 putative esterase [Streptomyces lasalocidi]
MIRWTDMRKDLHDLPLASCSLLAFGEPTHREPSFGWVRNELFAGLAGAGFRSIALETDRVAALRVDDFVKGGAGDLDEVMREGFSHGFGGMETNRRLVAWMRDHNAGLPPQEQLSFHGFDVPTETTSAPSPRRCLEHARDYLGLDLDLAGLSGSDEQWSRTEAVMDPAMSVGATVEADRLRSLADDMLTLLHSRAAERISQTSRAEWLRARTHLTAGLGLLRYHRQAALRLEKNTRLSRLFATRDALMAQNLLDIRSIEGRRGATLVFAHNTHLQRTPSTWSLGDIHVDWPGAGTVVAPLLGEEYVFVAGSLGRSGALGLGDPEPGTHESVLQDAVTDCALVPTGAATAARSRTDVSPQQGYFPLQQAVLDTADAVLHVRDGDAVTGPAGLTAALAGAVSGR